MSKKMFIMKHKRFLKRACAFAISIMLIIPNLTNVLRVEGRTDTGQEIYYSEDFEAGYTAGDPVSWTPRNQGNVSTTLTIDTIENVLKLFQPSTVGSSQWFTKVFHNEGLQGKYEVSFRIKASSAANTFLFLTDAANSKTIAQLCIRDNSYFCLDTGDGYPWNHKLTENASFEANTWYDVKFIVDTNKQSFDVTVGDGETYAYPFRESAENIGAIRVGCGGTTTDTAYFDDFVVQDCIENNGEEPAKELITIYDQDFENASTDDWINPSNSSGTISVVDMHTVAGVSESDASNALLVSKTQAGTGSYLVNHDFDKSLNAGIVTAQVKMMSDSTDAVSYFLLTDSSNNVVAQFGFYDSRGIAYQIGSEVISCKEYEAYKWYTFKLVFDTEQKIYKFYVNNELIADNVVYTNNVNISRLRLGMYNYSTGNVYYDDIEVMQDTLDRVYTTAVSPVTTLKGVAPVLPAKVTAVDSYGFSKEFSVVWDEVSESDYARAGKFDVNGTLEDGTNVSVNVVVKIDSTEIVYNEDFENNSTALDDWLGSNSSVSTDIVEYGTANKAAKIGKTTSNYNTVLTNTLAEDLGSTYARVEISGKILVDNKSSNAYFAVSDNSGNNLARVELYSNEGTVCVRNYGGTNSLGYYGFDGYAANTWYNVRFVFYPAQGRYHVYVNDKAVMSNIAYYKVNGVIRKVQIGFTNTNTGNVYFDDIEVKTDMVSPEYEVPSVHVTTKAGVKPVLSDLINATFEDRFVDSWSVDWNEMDAADYSRAGTFTVDGVASSFRSNETYHLTATVTVRENSNIAYYVDPKNGADNNDGTSELTAFKSLEKAKEAVSLVNQNMTGDINVYLMDGIYQMTDALVFNSNDSGSNGFYVHWQAAEGVKPVFSGGKEITGWTKAEGQNYYVASVPESEGYLDSFRQLYVDGERASRASSGWIVPTSFVTADTTYTGLKFNSSDLKDNYTNVDDMILAHVASFKYDEWHISDIEKNETSTTISCAREGDGLFSWRANTLYCTTSNNYMIVNAFEELDNEGEWYLDRGKDLIYYYPYQGQNMEMVSAYATVMESDQLIQFEGTTSNPVSNIILDGIALEYSNWLYPAQYSIGGSQAEALWSEYGSVKDISYGYQIPGAIRLNHTKDIQILNNTLYHMAGCGIQVYNDTSDTLIEGNATYDTTGAGIAVGRFCGSYLNDDRQEKETDKFTGNNLEGRVKDTLVRNNIVTDTGRDFLQATGISLMAALRTTVVNNTVENTAYMGIHTRLEVAGYYLTRNSTASTYYGNPTDTNLDVGQNIIAYNHVKESNWAHKYGLNDNASIYNFGPSNGTIIYRNYIEPSNTDWGMYNDDNSINVIWQENVLSGKNLYISNRCVDKNTIYLKNNYGIGTVVDNFCINSGNTTATTAAAQNVIKNSGLSTNYTDIRNKLRDTSSYHEIYANYDNLKISGGKITNGNLYSVNIIEAVGSNTQTANTEKNVFDGYLSTYWGSGTNFPETLVLTLEKETEVDNIEIYWYDPSGRYYQYKLYVSTTGTDATDWILAKDGTNNTTKGFTRDYFEGIFAKYIKVEITYSSLNSAAIREIVVNRTIPEPTELTLDKTQVSTFVGRVITLKASVIPTDAVQDVTWKSSNNKVATVADGEVTMVGAGKAAITATTINGISKSCIFTVYNEDTEVKVSSVSLNKKTENLIAGDSIKLTATVAPSNATNKDVTWQSSNVKAATVDVYGKVTAKGAGTAAITVTTKDGSKTASCKITVYDKAKSISVRAKGYQVSNITLLKGKKVTLESAVSPGTAMEGITYTSENKKVATVTQKGVVRAKQKGMAKIVIKSKDGKVTKIITIRVVNKKIANKKLQLKKFKATLKKKGAVVQITAKSLTGKTTDKITYRVIKGAKYVAVDKYGEVTAKIKPASKKKTAVIRVKCGKVSKNFTITLKK